MYQSGLDILGAGDTAGSRAVAAMQGWLGVPYIWGGSNPATGLDCSGAIYAAFRAAGVPAQRLTADQLYKTSQKISEGDVKPGDLVFYGSSWPGKVSHVMMAMGDGRVIGATGGGPGTTSPTPGASVQVKLTGYRRDVVGFGRPPVLGGEASWPWWATLGVSAAGLITIGYVSYRLAGRQPLSVMPELPQTPWSRPRRS